MLRAAPAATALGLLAGGCLWEPVQQAPAPVNADVAPVIQKVIPSNHEALVLTSQHAPLCVTQITLQSVYSPRAAPLTARFYLNYLDTTATQQPLSIEGQRDFLLQNQSQGDPKVYSLPTITIRLDDFVSQLPSPTNVLWVFVSDDFALCPDPSYAPQQTSPSGSTTLSCYTTSWSWVLVPNQCVLLNTP